MTQTQTFRCRECGELEYPGRWSNGERLKSRRLCFTCDGLTDIVERLADGDRTIAVPDEPLGIRRVMCIGPEHPKGGVRGFGGRPFIVRFKDGRTVRTTNLWCGLGIPKHFADRLRPNATIEPADEALHLNVGRKEIKR